jgi:glutamine synthetase
MLYKNNSTEKIEVKLYFSDILGHEKHVCIPVSDVKTALINGIKVDGSDIIGLTGICESEFILKPISRSKRIHRNNDYNMQIIYNCKVTTIDGTDIDEMTEDLMKNAIEEARILGFSEYDKQQLVDMLFSSSNTVPLNFAV